VTYFRPGSQANFQPITVQAVKRKILMMIFFFLLLSTSFTDPSAADALQPYRWENRVLLVFSPVEEYDLLQAQRDFMEQDADGYTERDLATFYLFPKKGTDPTGETLSLGTAADFYQTYGVERDEFVVILIGKDGGEKLRRTGEVMPPDLLFDTIDAMPMRQREIRDQ
jgi:hypothetical protein